MTQKSHMRILVVDDDFAFRIGTLALLEDRGYDAAVATSGEEACRMLAEKEYHLVVSDLVMPGMNGIDLLQRIKAANHAIAVIMVTGFASISTAIEAMRLGAQDYVTKPCDNDELILKIEKALDALRRDQELRSLRDEVRGVYSFGNMVGQNSRMREVYRLVEQVAGTDVPVLILGETGTGKELIARAIHYNSPRREKPFVVINCSALSETLLESELFGHEKGAFTGAQSQHIGKFEEGEGGTVFLDEIGDVSPHIQTKLLRVLQEREIQRVGGSQTLIVDIRVVAATNRDLQEEIRAGRFREDLFYRLNVFPLTLPPLRERIDDLPFLVEHFLKKHAALSQNRVTKLSQTLLPAMMSYEWRGNVRELENLIKRAIIKTPGDTIAEMELRSAAPAREKNAGPSAEGIVTLNTPFKEYLAAITSHAEETYLMRMLRLCKGNVNQIAKLMEIDRKTVYRKMAEHHIDPSSFRG